MADPFVLPIDIAIYIIGAMKTTQKTRTLLEEMGRIERMERGKVCKMKGRDHFNHQTWHKGRNLVRYVPREELDPLQADIAGYNRFMLLVQRYADEIIRITRRERAQKTSKRPKHSPPAHSGRI